MSALLAQQLSAFERDGYVQLDSDGVTLAWLSHARDVAEEALTIGDYQQNWLSTHQYQVEMPGHLQLRRLIDALLIQVLNRRIADNSRPYGQAFLDRTIIGM